MTPRKTTSEYRSYPWIKAQLVSAGWNDKNPNVDPRGQVWEQNEALSNSEIRKGLGNQKPEFVVRVTDNQYWTIEAKATTAQLAVALTEATGYADAINAASQVVSARFATGVAGTAETGYKVATLFLTLAGEWKPLVADGVKVDTFLAPKDALRVISADNPDVSAVPLTVAEVVEIGKFINKTLHSAKVPKERRALLVAILLLALQRDPDISYSGDAQVFLSDVNARARTVFEDANRVPLWESLQILPENENVAAQATALSQVLQVIRSNNILNTAKSTDILGAFFESFLKYGNTSKDLGIVLTPRHLCWLAAEAVGIGKDDVVYDPTVGTAGFLVAAFNRVLATATPDEAEKFATRNIYGIEHSGSVAALAFINMYFRGDGKHNLKIDSSLPYRVVSVEGSEVLNFKHGLELVDGESTRVTRVLMNPPFALPDEEEAEIRFVEHGLRQLVKNGILFSVLPSSVLYDSNFAAWRKNLLEHNTLLSVVALPTDAFYPVATESVGVFLKRGSKHNMTDDVLWVKLTDDGHVKRKGFRVERKGLHYKEFLKPTADALRKWMVSGIATPAVPGQLEFSPLASNEWLAQVHLGTGLLDAADFEQRVRESYRRILVQHVSAPILEGDPDDV
ncbi:class I SAM-dependent DNA methyltransferase [Microbacterium sp. PAMC22086]|uniref:HsdM family class I SAM-dependent methyltransferase n=1 Tax=Microbacterium sp. PAMC22086 TaxID=2861281 RepID=UPI001C631231|nr:N-6 DNA methylase [Microbacterium sp. PAMC22086]QYG11521.1 N-6 DNA methylase [Microbacterium sp. PAMC22086]